MDKKLSIQVYLQSLTEREAKNAIQLVKLFEDAKEEELESLLSLYVDSLERMAGEADAEELEMLVNTVYKGFRFKSECANALRYFYWGYYSRTQEEILSRLKQYAVQLRISQISARKHFRPIMRYLYQNGISQHKEIAASLKLDKSNLSRALEEVTASHLVNKIRGKKHVFYELSKKGYEYCKQHGMETEREETPIYWTKPYGEPLRKKEEKPATYYYESDFPIALRETREAKDERINRKETALLLMDLSDDYEVEKISFQDFDKLISVRI